MVTCQSPRLLDTYDPKRYGQHGAGRCIWKEVLVDPTVEGIDLVDRMAEVLNGCVAV